MDQDMLICAIISWINTLSRLHVVIIQLISDPIRMRADSGKLNIVTI